MIHVHNDSGILNKLKNTVSALMKAEQCQTCVDLKFDHQDLFELEQTCCDTDSNYDEIFDNVTIIAS